MMSIIRRLIIFLIIAIVALVVGIGLGYLLGNRVAASDFQEAKNGKRVEAPGPIVSVGDFTVNLADKEPHVVNFTLTLEAFGDKALSVLNDPGWQSHIRNEILLVMKDKIVDDIRTSEGIMDLSADLKRRLNSLLPLLKGKVPIRRVLFEKLVIQ